MYKENIKAAINYINSNVDDDIDLEDIARASNFSLSHLYKIFNATTGFTLKEYIRNSRLAEAARQLIRTDKRIIDIAMDARFESHEVFTRAFKSLYGVTPSDYKKNRKEMLTYDRVANISNTFEEEFQYQESGLSIDVRVEERGEICLVGMDFNTTIQENIKNNTIPHFWQNVFAPKVHDIKNIIDMSTTVSFEILDPKTDGVYHLASFEVSTPKAPEGMVLKILPPQKYAIFTPERVLGPLEYSELVRFAYGKWLPMSGFELSDEFTFDRMTHGYNNGEVVCTKMEFYIPIK